ncbi:amine dehydrogenase large subunit [Phenylobacterium sp. LjRoot219]|uniref:amine dehydrogenase large subunit n=1 Tax=Phenylobacterium sp. LjRoot219 TaxID=3342283 RepID=UPI003ED16D19
MGSTTWRAALASTAVAAVALSALPAAAQEPAQAAPPAATPPPLPSETLGTGLLPPATPHRYFLSARGGGVTIINGDTAKIEGTVNGSGSFGFAVAPDQSRFYISETIWSKQNRGKRQDLLSIYDGTTLELLHEVELPGRLIASGRTPYFNISHNGARGYVYNFEPAPSVITVDLVKRKVLSETPTPGCGLVFPFRDEGFASLCADGSLLSVTLDARGRAQATASPVFFDSENDPVFEESLVDRATGQAIFVTYTGLVHQVQLGAAPSFQPAWSILRAAGQGPATTAPDHKTWRPGGRRPFAYHPGSGRLYVLMHEGRHWTQKQAGSQVWVLDAKTQEIVRRIDLPTNGYIVSVSQDAQPLLYVTSEEGALSVMDPENGKVLRSLDKLGRTALAAVVGF